MQTGSFAQFPVIDSLKARITIAVNDKEKITAIRSLLLQINSLHPDTALHYFSIAKNLAERLGGKKEIRWVTFAMLSGKLAKGVTDSVLYKIENTAILNFPKSEDSVLFFKIQLLKANALNRMNDRSRALDLQMQLLNEAQKNENYVEQAYLNNYIGATYFNLGNQADAKRIWSNGLDLIQKNPSEKLNEIEATLNSNMMLYYHDLIELGSNKPMTDSFLLYTQKVIDQSNKHHIYWLIPTALSFRGEYYGFIKEFEKGKQDFTNAIEIRKKIGDPLYMANDMIHLASFYTFQQKYDSSISVLKEIQGVIKKSRLNELNKPLLSLLSYTYRMKGDFKSYSEALEQFILDADTVNKINAAEKIAEITARYDVQRKEATIANQKFQLSRRLNYIIAALLVIVVMFPLSLMYIRRMKRKQQAKNRLAVSEAEESERKRIAAELHDNLGVQANAILHNSTLLSGKPEENQLLINNLKNTAREMLANLRETVWALKTTEVSSAETWLRLISFIKQVKRNFPSIRFDISGEAPADISIDSVKALHILMIIKEAVNNAIRHSGAGEVYIKGMNQAEWIIMVTDNGSGFHVESSPGIYEGNGLSNMQMRASSGKFHLQIISSPGDGTMVKLIIPKQTMTA